VQQGSYGLILVAASLKDKGAYAHQVGDIRDGNAFSGLLMMKPGGELQREVKSPSQEGRVRFHDPILRRIVLDPPHRDCSSIGLVWFHVAIVSVLN
jgi:hypothetical protein